MLALQIPGGADDLLLQFDQLAALASLTGLGLTARRLLALAKDFVKRPDFREVQIPSGAPHLPVRSDVVGPGVPGHELVGLDAEIFQPQRSEEHTSELQSPCNL